MGELLLGGGRCRFYSFNRFAQQGKQFLVQTQRIYVSRHCNVWSLKATTKNTGLDDPQKVKGCRAHFGSPRGSIEPAVSTTGENSTRCFKKTQQKNRRISRDCWPIITGPWIPSSRRTRPRVWWSRARGSPVGATGRGGQAGGKPHHDESRTEIRRIRVDLRGFNAGLEHERSRLRAKIKMHSNSSSTFLDGHDCEVLSQGV